MELRRLATAVAVALVLVAGCSDETTDAGTTTTTTSEPSTPTSVAAPVVDWAAIGDVDLGGGWSLADAEGDGPFVAVRRDGTTVGTVEIVRFPLATLPAVQRVLAGGGSPAEALEAHAEEYLAVFAADRGTGCGDAYAFAPELPTLVDGPAGPVVRYGFRGGSPVTERNLQWAAISGDDLVLVSTTALDDGGCLAREGSELTVAQLDALDTRLAAAVEASPPPA